MKLKEIFDQAEDGILSWEQFEALAQGTKFVDLEEGAYVSKKKYEEDLQAKDLEITALNDSITTRDTDLSDLKSQLEAAGTSAEDLKNVSSEFEKLQSKYDSDMKSYKDQLKKQAYEFAVREFASTKKFTSNAAKRDFINSMIAKDLKMDNGSILGAEDFAVSYSSDNADAFYVEPEEEPYEAPQKPMFVNPTQGGFEPPEDPTGGFSEAFHFTPVRPMD